MRRIFAFIAAVLLLPASVAAWSGSPQRLDAVTSVPVRIAAAHDGAYGALVAWRPAGATGPIRVLHLLADGTIDPSWPSDGLALSSGTAACTGLEATEDLHGGAYIRWQEGQKLYLTRVLANGVIASGWTARGRLMGNTTSDRHRPWTELDADGSLYLGFFQGALGGVLTPSIRAFHLGLNGTGAGGWPAAGRSIPLDPEATEWVPSASFAVAGDGGMWVLVATGRVGEAGELPGEWRLARIMSNGTLDPSRPTPGTVLGPFDATPLLFEVPRIGIGAIADDGAFGLITAMTTITPWEFSSGWAATAQLARRSADGSVMTGLGLPLEVGRWDSWTSAGCNASFVGACETAAFSLRLFRDGDHGVAAAYTETYTDAPLSFEARYITATGLSHTRAGSGWGVAPRMQQVSRGGFLTSSFSVTGPNYWTPPPTLSLYWSDGRGVELEEDFSPYEPVYSDLAAAPLPDGGAIAVWGRLFTAQSGKATGMYAQRIGADGTPLDAPQPPLAIGRLTLSRSGSDVLASWPAGAAGTLRLHDVLGREVARADVGSDAGSARLMLEGAAPSGIYFGRLTRRDGSSATARVFMLN